MKSILMKVFVVLILLVVLYVPSYAVSDTQISLTDDIVATSTSSVATITSLATQPIYVTLSVDNATGTDEVWYMTGTETLDVGSGTMILAGANDTFELPALGLFAFISSTTVSITATCTAVADHAINIDLGSTTTATSTTSVVVVTSLATQPIDVTLAVSSDTYYEVGTNTLIVGSGTLIPGGSSAVFEVPASGIFSMISTITNSVTVDCATIANYALDIDLGSTLTATSTTSVVVVTSLATQPIYVTLAVNSDTYYEVGTETLIVGSGTLISGGSSGIFEVPAVGKFAMISAVTNSITADAAIVTTYAQDVDINDSVVATCTTSVVVVSSIATRPMDVTITVSTATSPSEIWYIVGTSTLVVSSGTAVTDSSSATFEVPIGSLFSIISSVTTSIEYSAIDVTDYAQTMDVNVTTISTSTVETVVVDSAATVPMDVTITVPAATPSRSVWYINGTSTIAVGSGTEIESGNSANWFAVPVGSKFAFISSLTTPIEYTSVDVTSYTRSIATPATVLATSTYIVSRITNTGTVPMYFTVNGAEATYVTRLHYAQSANAATSSTLFVTASSTSKVFEVAVGDYITLISTQTMPISITAAQIATMEFTGKAVGDSFNATATVGVVTIAHNATENVNITVTLDSSPADAVVYYSGVATDVTFGGAFLHAHAGESFNIDVASGGYGAYISNYTISAVATISYIDITKTVLPGTPQTTTYASTRARTWTMPSSTTRYKLLISPTATGTVHVALGTTATTTAGVCLEATQVSPLLLQVPPGNYVSLIASTVIPLDIRMKKQISPRRSMRIERQ